MRLKRISQHSFVYDHSSSGERLSHHGVAPSMFNANRRNSNASDGLPDNLLLVTLPKPSNPVKQERAVSATCALTNTTPAVAVAKDFRRRSSADKRNENRIETKSVRTR